MTDGGKLKHCERRKLDRTGEERNGQVIHLGTGAGWDI